jgi:soluble lytic murein transglycosylase-like protein
MEIDYMKLLISQYAVAYELPSDIIFGIVMTESSGNQYAMRYEKNYKWLMDPKKYKPHGCTEDTERTLQKFSFGLMQTMGAVFRELGFTDLLSKIIVNPDLQLDYGCRFLKKKIDKYGLDEGILSYNSGSPIKRDIIYINQYYLDKVRKYSKQY